MAKSGWCIDGLCENKAQPDKPRDCAWDKCDCTCHTGPTGTAKMPKKKPVKRKGGKKV